MAHTGNGYSLGDLTEDHRLYLEGVFHKPGITADELSLTIEIAAEVGGRNLTSRKASDMYQIPESSARALGERFRSAMASYLARRGITPHSPSATADTGTRA